MLSLPPIETDRGVWSIPISSASGVALAQALLEGDAFRRELRLAACLRHEPTLVFWSLVRADDFRGMSPNDVRTLAQWLDRSATQVLQWPDEASTTLGSAAEWGAWSADCLLAAHRATRPVVIDHDRAFLAALLRAMLRCRVPVDAAAVPVPSPDWLTALRREADVPELNETPYSNLHDEALRRAIVVRWSATESAELLPRLMRVLKRRNELEAQFAAALERAKLDSLKELAYGASHEINNPLANIAMRAQALLRDEPSPERRRALEAINAQAFRAHAMIADLMLFARPPALHREPCDLQHLLESAVNETRCLADEQGTELHLHPARAVKIVADPTALTAAIIALLTNAIEALRSGGHVWVTLAASAPGVCPAGVTIQVRDDGPGIPPEIRPHIFDPFFSGREAGRGLGFGLSKCWRIVEQHGGRIEASSEVGRGSTFSLWLPLRAVEPSPARV